LIECLIDWFNHAFINTDKNYQTLFASIPDVQYKYYMVVSPLDGRLYISDHQNLRIIRVKTMGAVRELTQNFEVVAGTGEQCVPGDTDQCGDGAPATAARLFYPKGN